MMRRPLIVIFLLALLCACGNREKYARLLAEADSLNQNYIPFTTDSTMKEVVDYYDHHGTANERMRAYYLLGCVYRDLGEAPQALECYHDAVDCADTTARDCDYKLLSRVYGQMAYIFDQEFVPNNEIVSSEKAYHYAMLANDTTSALIFLNDKANAYEKLGQIDSVKAVALYIFHRFREIGNKEHAARALNILIYTELHNHEYKQAKQYMDYYEKESGFYDKEEVIDGKQIYYYFKGLYYIGIKQLDSAEYFFRKLLHEGKDYNDIHAAYDGLFKVYTDRHVPDSLSKYAILSTAYNDSLHSSLRTEDLQRTQSLYDYSRHQRLAEQKDREASNARLWLLFVSFIAILIIVLLCWLFVDIRHRNRHKTQLMRQKFVDDMIYLRTEHAKVIGSLEQRLKQYKKLSEIPNEDEIEAEMRNSAVVQKMQQIGSNKLRGIVTNDDWKAVEQIFDQCLPHFYSIFHNAHYTISREDYYLCMLIRMGFKPKEISNLTGYSSQTVTYIRSRLMQRVFNIEGGAKEFDEMLKCIR